MKFKTTTKAIREGSCNLRCAGYCDLCHLLRGHEPVAYTCGVYGWNYDVYEVYGLTICTGYRGMPGKQLKGIAEFEEKAKKIWSWENKEMTFEKKKEAVETLLYEFCKTNGGY